MTSGLCGLRLQLNFQCFEIKSDLSLMQIIKEGYHIDPWHKLLAHNLSQGIIDNKLGISSWNGMIFIGTRLIILKHKDICENLFHLTHDNLSHFSTEKSYATLRNNFTGPICIRTLSLLTSHPAQTVSATRTKPSNQQNHFIHCQYLTNASTPLPLTSLVLCPRMMVSTA